MRRCKSYSIVDHELLHGGHLHALSHEALALYLFLIVVSDKEGRSFYRAPSIQGILRMPSEVYVHSLEELRLRKLVDYRYPYFFVQNLSESKSIQKKTSHPKKEIHKDEAKSWSEGKEQIAQIKQMLNKKKENRHDF